MNTVKETDSVANVSEPMEVEDTNPCIAQIDIDTIVPTKEKLGQGVFRYDAETLYQLVPVWPSILRAPLFSLDPILSAP